MKKNGVGKTILTVFLIICFFPFSLIYWGVKVIVLSKGDNDGISMDEIIDNEELME